MYIDEGFLLNYLFFRPGLQWMLAYTITPGPLPETDIIVIKTTILVEIERNARLIPYLVIFISGSRFRCGSISISDCSFCVFTTKK